MLGESPNRVKRYLEDNQLLATKVDGVLQIPALFFQGNEPLKELKGTITMLRDGGYSPEESLRWLLEEEELLGSAPIAAIREGRKTEIRRVIQRIVF